MKIIFPCFRLFLTMVLLTGIIYPLFITGLAQVLFPHQAQGSLVVREGHTVGSELLSQKTVSPRYFWPRPSADDYATIASGASNLGPGSDALKKAIAGYADKIDQASGLTHDTSLPGDLITASGSGLDPEISPGAAQLQITRVARARNFSEEQTRKLTALVTRQEEAPQLGFLGEPRVNVLLLNLATDQIK